MPLRDNDLIIPEPTLVRSISINYIYNDNLSSDAPNSFDDEERIKRENAILEQFPKTSYANTIINRRAEESVSLQFPF